MEPELWQRVEQICLAALDLEENEQITFVAASCANDPELHREVDSLLAERHREEQFMEIPALEVAAKVLATEEMLDDSARMLGRTVSHYRIVEKIGAGGMGEVYRAIRADGTYEMEVAVKLIRGGFGSAYFLSRFRNERQILAGLQHPNIARLLDGGTTEDGLPFFVMEYVQGIPIDEYCERQGLSVPQRLALFRTVCLAVQYAHQNLVLHRDLKPGNILVTREGRPMLLDFGIAKITKPNEPDGAGEMMATVLPMMTPDFASPEQIRNQPVMTASDIYSLGVILYLLLSGRLPFKGKDRPPHEIARAICEIEPDKPSSVVRDTAESKTERPPWRPGTRLAEAAKTLAGDLDNIVLKAICKEPTRRYSSVEQLSEDVRRYLEGLPVVAHKDSLRYRAVKFVRREKKIAGAVALVILSLAAGTVAALREAHIARAERARAERRFNDVRTLANSLIFDLNDAIKDLPGSTAARELVVSKALTYLDSLAQEATGDLSLERDLATAYERVGEVQGSFDTANLGDTSGALASYQKAAAIREAVAGGEHESVQSLNELANAYEMLSRMFSANGQYNSALEYAQKTFDIEQQLAGKDRSPETQEGLAGSYYVLGLSHSNLGDFQAALADLQKSAALREGIAGAPPALDSVIKTRLSGTYGEMSFVFSHMDQPEKAIGAARKGLAVMSALSAAHTDSRLYRQYVFEHTSVIGNYFEQMGNHSEAEKNYKIALAGFKATAAADPEDTNSKLWLGVCESDLGKVQVELGETVAGLANIRNGLEIALALYGSDPAESSDKLPNVADAYAASGFAYSQLAAQPDLSTTARRKDWEQARLNYEKSLDAWQQAERLHVVLANNLPKVREISEQIAVCDAALAKP